MNKIIFHVQKNTKESNIDLSLKKKELLANQGNNKDSIQLVKKTNQTKQTIKNQNISNINAKTQRIQQKISEESTEQKGKSIRQIEKFFQQRYLGPKKNSKIANFNKLLKTPLYNPQVSSTIFKMKTPNLNKKLKQIEKIFTQEKKSMKNKNIKVLAQDQNLTQFQLYLTKRDVLRQKNQGLEEMRKFWLQEKQKQEEKRLKRKLRQIKKYQQENRNQQENKNILVTPQRKQIQQQEAPNNKETLSLQVTKTKSISLPLQMNNDQYFQKKFEQKIIKNTLSGQHKFSIRSMLEPSRNRKTTISNSEFFKNELDVIQNVAKNTIDNFHQKQIINKILYSQTAEEEDQLENMFKSKRLTPVLKEGLEQKQVKSIDWVLKQCQNFRSNFHIRKAKSVSLMKRNS